MRVLEKTIIVGTLLVGFGLLQACGNELDCGNGTIKVGDECLVDTSEADADTDTDADSDADSGIGGNSPPTKPSVVISPSEPTSSDDLTCIVAVDSTDPDGDPVSYRFVWLQNDAPTGNNTSNYSAENTTTGDSIVCRVTPNDGTQDGTAGLALVSIQ